MGSREGTWQLNIEHFKTRVLNAPFIRHEPETLSVAEDVGSLLVSQAAHCVTMRQALALVCRAVGRVGEAAPVTPLVHT